MPPQCTPSLISAETWRVVENVIFFCLFLRHPTNGYSLHQFPLNMVVAVSKSPPPRCLPKFRFDFGFPFFTGLCSFRFFFLTVDAVPFWSPPGLARCSFSPFVCPLSFFSSFFDFSPLILPPLEVGFFTYPFPLPRSSPILRFFPSQTRPPLPSFL